ncbi:hypothetical protein VT84_13745 [Gemmata sp. SH-PL17]|uniref:helix-turn-helix transcriptional regulator n=1 Tax=Gemmata sp. SH-PL17 TaxID=1630693 RepID=UPI0004BC3B6C|nr:helix-turn-helix transcriptional regulator [Gemmata sp. SH-PL17]AMV25456.1 hypothetical protein VT84_13745 [Gemmata sp. SH-PL17]
MTNRDPLRALQAAARAIADHVSPGRAAKRVIVLDDVGKLIDVPVPCGACAKADEVDEAKPPVVAGWVVTERGATFDGTAVLVAPSRLRLLRVFIEAENPLTAKELTAAAFDRHTDEANTRYHIRELRRELKTAFTFDGDVIQGEADGYRLVLR